MRWLVGMTTTVFIMAMLSGCSRRPEEVGLAYSGSTHADNVQFLVDETWVDEAGQRHVSQEIFDSVFDIIDNAREFVLLDFFLLNDFMYESGPGMRPLSQQLTDRLLLKRKINPDMPIVFITDPINTVYGSLESSQLKALQAAGVTVVTTDLNQLRDSNPIYSKPWRLLVKRWGTGPGSTMRNPFGEGRISLRSMLKMLNFKANHRKLIATEKSLLVTTANPHSASSAHWNVALRVDGAGTALACEAESAILKMAGVDVQLPVSGLPPSRKEGNTLELLTEKKIEERALVLLNGAGKGARIDLGMFYLSDHAIIKAIINARKRGCNVHIILDPNKDAFGRIKKGIPNRQSAVRLVKAAIPLRWAGTHGEQFHVKMLYVEQPGDRAAVLLGSCNYTRRNLDNYNAECDMAFTAPKTDEVMNRCRNTFDRWWSNPDGHIYTTDYGTYADPSLWRRTKAWLMETTGMSSF